MELVFKIAGTLFVLGSSGYSAYALNGKIDQRKAELRRLYSILLQLKSEIQYMGNPLPLSFEKMAEQEQYPFSVWFGQMADRLQEKEKVQFADLWEEDILHLYEISALKREDLEPLLSLKDKLGALDITTQMKALDYVLLQLEHNRQNLEEEIKQKKKMVMSISVFIGFMTLILFI